mmetsp:Transcript_96171/g.272270  ORF Transcript_96171/g.272270 Transcript_96171/m.272270 type:complete len:200 (+) Transcript_96171:1736-2335(+)
MSSSSITAAKRYGAIDWLTPTCGSMRHRVKPIHSSIMNTSREQFPRCRWFRSAAVQFARMVAMRCFEGLSIRSSVTLPIFWPARWITVAQYPVKSYMALTYLVNRGPISDFQSFFPASICASDTTYLLPASRATSRPSSASSSLSSASSSISARTSLYFTASPLELTCNIAWVCASPRSPSAAESTTTVKATFSNANMV